MQEGWHFGTDFNFYASKKVMDFVFIISAFMVGIVFPLSGACMAKICGRRFWPWFWLSVPLPFITLFILILLPDKSTYK